MTTGWLQYSCFGQRLRRIVANEIQDEFDYLWLRENSASLIMVQRIVMRGSSTL